MTRSDALALPAPTDIVAVISQRVGVGRTTIAVNLALALAAAGCKVLLIDLDPKGQTQHCLVHGGSQHGDATATRLLLEGTLTRDMLVATEIPDLYLIPAGNALHKVESELTLVGDSRSRLYQACAALPSLPLQFNVVIIDCPAGLGLLTLNAVTAAHRLLLPIAADPPCLPELEAIFTTISRVRAGLTQPLHGVHIVLNHCLPSTSPDTLAAVRQLYGRLLLISHIPHIAALHHAEPHRPLLAQSCDTPSSQSYLTLAAEWLLLTAASSEGVPTKTRHQRLEWYQIEMRRRIEAWLIDPSSLLYDPIEAMRYQDAVVLEELFQVTQPSHQWRVTATHLWMSAVFGMALLFIGTAWRYDWGRDDQWRIDMAALFIGTEQYWQAGSQLLARADETAYRELLLATQLIDTNREQLRRCGENAHQHQNNADCTITVTPP